MDWKVGKCDALIIELMLAKGEECLGVPEFCGGCEPGFGVLNICGRVVGGWWVAGG